MKRLTKLTVVLFVAVLTVAAYAGNCKTKCGAAGACPAGGKKSAEKADCNGCTKDKACGKCPTVEKSEEHAAITVEALDALLRSGSPVVVVDARSGKYDDGRRIPGAKSLTDTSSAEEVAKVVPAKDQLVVTYCASTECPASARLAKHLKALGYANVVELPTGIKGWTEAGKPVDQAK